MGLKYAMALGLCALAFNALAETSTKEIALTIDDLPYVGNAHHDTGKLRRERKRFLTVLEILDREKIPATGFVIAGAIEKDQWALLEAFKQSGHTIANHTFSHKSLNSTSLEFYQNDIEKADQILSPLMPEKKYFRYPFLATGRDCPAYRAIRTYLNKNAYTIAPVTIDSKDFEFNERYHHIPWQTRRSIAKSFGDQYVNFVLRQTTKAEKKAISQVGRPIKQILLIHMNTVNAVFLPRLIQAFRDRGYRFISLSEALSDPYYQEKKYLLSQFNARCKPMGLVASTHAHAPSQKKPKDQTCQYRYTANRFLFTKHLIPRWRCNTADNQNASSKKPI